MARRSRGLASTDSLLARVHDAAVAERRRLSREIHDRLGHAVTAAYQNLELFDIYLATDRTEAERRAGIARQLLREAVDALPNLINDLRLAVPPENLVTALLEHANPASTAKTHVVINGDLGQVAPPVRDQSFLVLREALRNAVTHGQPRNVWITIDIVPDELRASVHDDGAGFELDTTGPGTTEPDTTGPGTAGRATGYGLVSMTERAAIVGGTLKIHSRVGQGTRVDLVVPLRGVHFEDQP